MLEVSNLTRSFRGPEGTVRALDGVCFGVTQGEFVAVHGPSGCGKTTLLLVCGGLLQPGGGDVSVNGENPYQLPRERRSRFRAERAGLSYSSSTLCRT
jgi:ABC-type lipoprotein export system ATPase subunit